MISLLMAYTLNVLLMPYTLNVLLHVGAFFLTGMAVAWVVSLLLRLTQPTITASERLGMEEGAEYKLQRLKRDVERTRLHAERLRREQEELRLQALRQRLEVAAREDCDE